MIAMIQWAAIWMIGPARQIRKKMDRGERHAVQMKANHKGIVQSRGGNVSPPVCQIEKFYCDLILTLYGSNADGGSVCS